MCCTHLPIPSVSPSEKMLRLSQQGQELEDPGTKTGPLCLWPLAHDGQQNPFTIGDKQVDSSSRLDSTPGDPTSSALSIHPPRCTKWRNNPNPSGWDPAHEPETQQSPSDLNVLWQALPINSRRIQKEGPVAFGFPT